MATRTTHLRYYTIWGEIGIVDTVYCANFQGITLKDLVIRSGQPNIYIVNELELTNCPACITYWNVLRYGTTSKEMQDIVNLNKI